MRAKAETVLQDKEEYLKKLPYWQYLSQDEKRLALRHAFLYEYKKGSVVRSFGGECLGMLTVIRGEIRTYILSEEGREITLFRMHAGERCVLSASCVIDRITFDTQMVAEEDTFVLVLGANAFAKLAEENVYVRCDMYEQLTERFSSVMWTMQQILFMGFDRRLAAFLLSECERTGKKEIRMSHEKIAQHTSSAREVVARMLKRFASEGMLEYRRGAVLLKDMDALAETAGVGRNI